MMYIFLRCLLLSVSCLGAASSPESADDFSIYNGRMTESGLTIQANIPARESEVLEVGLLSSLLSSLSQTGCRKSQFEKFFQEADQTYRVKAAFSDQKLENFSSTRDLSVLSAGLRSLSFSLQYLATHLGPAIVATQNSALFAQDIMAFPDLCYIGQGLLKVLPQHIAYCWALIGLDREGCVKSNKLCTVSGQNFAHVDIFNALWASEDAPKFVREAQQIVSVFSKILDHEYRMTGSTIYIAVLKQLAKINGEFLYSECVRVNRLLPYITTEVDPIVEKGIEALNERFTEHNRVCEILDLQSECFPDSCIPTQFSSISLNKGESEPVPTESFEDLLKIMHNPTEFERYVAAQVVRNLPEKERKACEGIWDLKEAQEHFDAINEYVFILTT